MTGMEADLEKTLVLIGFRPNTNGLGIGMRVLVEQVEIVAVESPIGLHLTFTAYSSRNASQCEVQLNRDIASAQIAKVIVDTIEESFSDFIASSKRGEA